MTKKIVITGGLGYIGTELCKIYSGVSWNNEIIVIEKMHPSKFMEGNVVSSEAKLSSLRETTICTDCSANSPLESSTRKVIICVP